MGSSFSHAGHSCSCRLGAPADASPLSERCYPRLVLLHDMGTPNSGYHTAMRMLCKRWKFKLINCMMPAPVQGPEYQ